MYILLEMSQLGTSSHCFVTVKELVDYVAKRSVNLDRQQVQFEFDVVRRDEQERREDELDGLYYASLND